MDCENIENYSLLDTDGIVYIITINNVIFKIGQSSYNWYHRMSDYNNGRYAANGTNYFVYNSCKSMYENGDVIELYIWIAQEDAVHTMFGSQSSNANSAKIAEDECLDEYEAMFGHYPPGNAGRM